MKTYPYHTPEGIIELVEKRELDQLLERLAEARDSHLAASARNVQTIQRQAIMLERWKTIATDLQRLVGGAPKLLGKKWEDAADTALDQYDEALSAYESTNPEPVNPVDVQTIQRQSVELASADREIERLNLMVKMMDESEELAKRQAILLERMEAVPVEELTKIFWGEGQATVSSWGCDRVRTRLIQAAKGEQP